MRFTGSCKSLAAESVTKYARHSPLPVFELPHVSEVTDTIKFFFLCTHRQVKAVLAHGQRSKALEYVNPHSSVHEFPSHAVALISTQAFRQRFHHIFSTY